MLVVMGIAAAVGLAVSSGGPDVDRYSVTYLWPSTSVSARIHLVRQGSMLLVRLLLVQLQFHGVSVGSRTA